MPREMDLAEWLRKAAVLVKDLSPRSADSATIHVLSTMLLHAATDLDTGGGPTPMRLRDLRQELAKAGKAFDDRQAGEYAQRILDGLVAQGSFDFEGRRLIPKIQRGKGGFRWITASMAAVEKNPSDRSSPSPSSPSFVLDARQAEGAEEPIVDAQSLELNLAAYALGLQRANAIRLVGAADECFARDRVRVSYDPSPYVLPPLLARDYDRRLEAVRRSAQRQGSPFFDGPCVRLSRLVVSVHDASEDKHIEATLGPLGWFDFSVADHLVHEATRDGWYEELLAEYVDLAAVRRCDFSQVHMPNIIETVTTVITADRQILYTWRSAVSTVAEMYSATVSENIHRQKDADDAGVPDPFRTVRRGLGEELSPNLADCVNESDLVLLGLCFNLDELHPTFLFLARVPMTLRELFVICREAPGRDFKESIFRAVPAHASGRAVKSVFLQRPWYASGEACLMRAIEFLRASEKDGAGAM